ncbi:MAG TPA: cytochrome o ubiquinol oxidase subunit IV [Patescibacteria group bacterium]|nr:cytochrome o ubiquinol oxidase subunit IV [Patescibacteria group bacterium]
MKKDPHGSFKSYIIGFLLSVIVTLCSYFIVVNHLVPRDAATTIILTLAGFQLVVQLVFFLHLYKESGPRWNLVIFISTIGIVFLVVIGSIWIMYHLNNNMTPTDMSHVIQSEEGILK